MHRIMLLRFNPIHAFLREIYPISLNGTWALGLDGPLFGLEADLLSSIRTFYINNCCPRLYGLMVSAVSSPCPSSLLEIEMSRTELWEQTHTHNTPSPLRTNCVKAKPEMRGYSIPFVLWFSRGYLIASHCLAWIEENEGQTFLQGTVALWSASKLSVFGMTVVDSTCLKRRTFVITKVHSLCSISYKSFVLFQRIKNNTYKKFPKTADPRNKPGQHKNNSKPGELNPHIHTP